MRKILFSLLLLSWGFSALAADKPVSIKIKLTDYTPDTLLMGYHYGDKQYLQDTAVRGADGYFTFEDTKTWACGVYLVIMKPSHSYFQILIREGEQKFSIDTKASDPYGAAVLKGAPDNELFFNYMKYLGGLRSSTEPIRIQRDSGKTEAIRQEAQKKLDGIDKEVKAYQQNILTKHAGTLTALLIKTAQRDEVPEQETFPGPTDDDRKQQRYLWYKAHYFDNYPLDNPCIVRTPMLQSRMDTFLVRVVPQHPDSINMELDKMLAKMNYDKSDSSDIYKYYLTHFLNHYAKSEFVGMDAVYVHLALKYYENAKTSPWLVDSVRAKIVNDARRLDPILIGKTAPNVRLFKRDGSSLALYDIKSPYTILMVWDPECGHCKKSMPDYEKFYAEWKDKGVEIFSICNRRTEIEKCWEYIDKEEGRMNWLNLVDPYLQSRYTTLYDVKTTPKVYILNSEKKILSKGVGAEQLDSVMDQLIEMENKRLKETLKKD